MKEKIKLKGLTREQTEDLLPDNLILLGYRGSIVHGTYIKNTDPNSIDDKDIMGVFVGSLSHYFGFDKMVNKEKFVNEWDSVFYETRKFIGLLLKANPNVLSLLWLPERYLLFKNVFGQMLIDNRDLFVSQQIYHSFTGYAYGQLKRMENFSFNGYMGEKRKKLVTELGYDAKNASHLIRLLRMGIEFLKEGELHVVREDAPELIKIKKGEYSLNHIKAMADDLFKVAQDAYLHSSLPVKPDYNRAESLLYKIITGYYHLIQDRKCTSIL